MSKPSVIFFGNERLATGVSTKCPTLTKLINSGFEVKAVISQHQVGLSRSKRQLEISEIADSNSIPHLFPTSSKEILEIVKSHKADIGVLVAFGKIVPQTVIDALPMGIINLHPSLLPKHRGPTQLNPVLSAAKIKLV
jgi:methionyl-tRNA formyltransferase